MSVLRWSHHLVSRCVDGPDSKIGFGETVGARARAMAAGDAVDVCDGVAIMGTWAVDSKRTQNLIVQQSELDIMYKLRQIAWSGFQCVPTWSLLLKWIMCTYVYVRIGISTLMVGDVVDCPAGFCP